ncbi:MAG: hypothetical protein ACRCYU_13675 [Nocardioides sp.]
MTTTHRIRVFLVVSLLVAGLTACSGEPDSAKTKAEDKTTTSPSTSAESSDGSTESGSTEPGSSESADAAGDQPQFVGDGYGFDAPEEWTEETEVFKAAQPTLDLAVAEADRADGYANNVTVTTAPAGGIENLDALEAQAIEQTKNVASKVRTRGRGPIAGTEASLVTSNLKVGKLRVNSAAFYVLRKDQVFVIVFSFLKGTSGGVVKRTTSKVLDSWQWDPATTS